MQHRKHTVEDGSQPGGPSSDEQVADDYLSKLAKSILSKEKRSSSSSENVIRPIPPIEKGRVRASQPADQNQSSRSSQRIMKPFQKPQKSPSDTDVRKPVVPVDEWVREVRFYDQAGNMIPGTILVFEDGNVGVFKERHPTKDYDVVYMLTSTGEAAPQGMPLYNYEVEPIGRLSRACLEQLLKTGTWDRDMMVFHLLKFKDRNQIPHITQEPQRLGSSERVSKMTVPKLDIEPSEQTDSAPQDEPKEEQALTRGRRITIEFGPNQKWQAIYWGKDELGHVLAHHTHEKWSLMHLDLNRFKDSIAFNDIADDATIRQLEKDCVAH